MDISKMSLDEFCAWATGKIVFGIGQGFSLRVLVYEILNNFLLNWLPAHGWKKEK